jgi:hypothetical protein
MLVSWLCATCHVERVEVVPPNAQALTAGEISFAAAPLRRRDGEEMPVAWHVHTCGGAGVPWTYRPQVVPSPVSSTNGRACWASADRSNCRPPFGERRGSAPSPRPHTVGTGTLARALAAVRLPGLRVSPASWRSALSPVLQARCSVSLAAARRSRRRKLDTASVCARRRHVQGTPGAPPTLDWGRECARLGTAVVVGLSTPRGWFGRADPASRTAHLC